MTDIYERKDGPTHGEGSADGDQTIDPIIQEAKDRFKRCADWESNARQHFSDDIKFAEADALNGYQWPDDLRKSRQLNQRPALTINKTRQHNLLIINDAKKNKPGITFRPTGNGATYEAAQMLMAMTRRIEYNSNATAAYDHATSFQVKGGIGWFKIDTEYAGDNTFDQEIKIKLVKDPMSIYMDPDIQEADGSDAKFAFEFTDLPKEEFKKQVSKEDFVKLATTNLFGESNWTDEDHVRVLHYWRKVEKPDKLLAYLEQGPNGISQRKMIRKSRTPSEEFYKEKASHPMSRERDVVDGHIEWKKIVGNRVLEEKSWAGKYIPLVRVIGEETIIENQLDRKGHTRALLDPQRMYNFWSSAATEGVALQTKTPWLAPLEAIEDNEQWQEANLKNAAVLTYKHKDESDELIPPPQRIEGATMAQAYLQGMQVTNQEIMEVSGQYQPQMGEPSNERSGKAIQERQRQGDTATYHFIDNLAIAIRFGGKIILDLIPKIYDTERLIKAMAEDQSDMEIKIDPSAAKAHQLKLGEDGKVAERILNPGVGEYEVMADVGPNFATRREEAFNAFSQILTAAPNLTSLIGDILFRAGDFPNAEEAAERLKRMVPKQALGEGPSQTELQLQQQNQMLNAMLAKANQVINVLKISLKGKDEMRDIDAYEAETKRWQAMLEIAESVNPEGVKSVINDLIRQSIQTQLGPILAANLASIPALAGSGGNFSPQPQLQQPGAMGQPNGQPGMQQQ